MNYTTKEEIATFEGHDKVYAGGLKFTTDSKYLLTGGNKLIFWSIAYKKQLGIIETSSNINYLVLDENDKYLALAQSDKVFTIFDFQKIKLCFQTSFKPLSVKNVDTKLPIWNSNTSIELNQHTSLVWKICIKNEFLYSGSYDNSIIVWNLDSCKEVCRLIGHSNVVRSLLVCEKSDILFSCLMTQT